MNIPKPIVALRSIDTIFLDALWSIVSGLPTTETKSFTWNPSAVVPVLLSKAARPASVAIALRTDGVGGYVTGESCSWSWDGKQSITISHVNAPDDPSAADYTLTILVTY